MPSRIPPLLGGALRHLAARPRILVAVDYDGVLAPLVDQPERAVAPPDSRAALVRLSQQRGVQVALVSGRALDDLRRVAQPPAGVWLVGSHGAEMSLEAQHPRLAAGPVHVLDRAQASLLERITLALTEISLSSPGTHVELKPAAAVLHTRRAGRSVAEKATVGALTGPAAWPGVHVRRGKEVVELSVVVATVGGALQRLRTRAGLMPGAGGVLYIGDELTDEDVFSVLDDASGDVTVTVGSGATVARHRLQDCEAVAELLSLVAHLRAEGPG